MKSNISIFIRIVYGKNVWKCNVLKIDSFSHCAAKVFSEQKIFLPLENLLFLCIHYMNRKSRVLEETEREKMKGFDKTHLWMSLKQTARRFWRPIFLSLFVASVYKTNRLTPKTIVMDDLEMHRTMATILHGKS